MTDRLSLQGFDLRDRTAAVIGCGGLGCHIATHLVCAGIERLIICDFDTVSESNLNRQFLYTYADVGKPKVQLAKERLSAINPDAVIEAVSEKIKRPKDLSFADGADIVFAALDNLDARKTLQEYCRRKGKPLANGGVNGFYGTAYLWIPGRTPDLAAAGLLERANARTVSISSTVGIIAALEAQLGIQYLTGRKDVAGRLHILSDNEIQTMKIKEKNDNGTL